MERDRARDRIAQAVDELESCRSVPVFRTIDAGHDDSVRIKDPRLREESRSKQLSDDFRFAVDEHLKGRFCTKHTEKGVARVFGALIRRDGEKGYVAAPPNGVGELGE